ncbi:hypothetical protein SOV_22570 [Sporomusa ovata DSM 2662]|uniref:Uncharacterized protein n=1 Tax=Sporomusa ovata TaxID=2378 RepID=A0A0U1L361_9FIRM|nr:helix-turn-helix domain-containing protein [Sporomusa ovata]EQB25573.1 helix-turn-helix domain containing protein [Sporomusa ovata DSM 2662]CQR74131.1 hypothetical protein SpAn4DRAFT_0593 [Sporomusa ovata]
MPALTEIKPLMSEKGVYKGLRIFKGWSRDIAAMHTAMSPKTIERIEKGKDPTKDQVLMMDRAYGCGGQLVDYWLGRLKLSSGNVRQVNNISVVRSIPDTQGSKRFNPWKPINLILGAYFIYEFLKGVW